MTLAWIVFAIMAAFALYDTKKAILVWLPLRLLFNPQISLKFTAPALSVDLGVSLMLCAMYFLRYYGRESYHGLNRGRFILIPVFFVTLFSYLISYSFSDIPISSSINATFKYFVMTFLLLYVFHKSLNSQQDFKLFTKVVIVIVVLITALGIYEFATGDNPFLDYVYLNTPHNDYLEGRMGYIPPSIGGNVRDRYGLVRCYSFFQLHLRFGTACVFLLFFVGTLVYSKISDVVKRRYVVMCLALLIIGVFISNSKQAYLSIIVVALCFYRLRKLLNYRIILPIIIVIFIWQYFPELFNNYFSLVDEELAEEGGGSTIELRKMQYDVAWDMFKLNPLVGNGPGSINAFKLADDYYKGIRGAESIWLDVLPERGIIGAIAYLFMFIFLFNKGKKVIPSKPLFFYLLTIFVAENAGGQKDATLYLCVLLAVMRYYQLYPINKKKTRFNNGNYSLSA